MHKSLSKAARAHITGWLEPRRRASALDALASPLNYGSKSLSESRQAKHPMPSPKHSASTGIQQPNTADSQGPADLDFINEFQCTNRFQKRQEHTSRPGISGKRAGDELSGKRAGSAQW